MPRCTATTRAGLPCRRNARPGSDLCFCHQGNPGGHACAAEMELRVAEVVQCIATGGEKSDVVRLAAQRWGLSKRSADDLMTRAMQAIREECELTLDEHRAKAVKRLSTIQSLANADRQYGAAIGAQRELDKLLGLHAPERVEHSGPGGAPMQVEITGGPAALLQFLDDARAAVAEAVAGGEGG